MNSDLLKRLFRAINQDNVEAINKLAQIIIKEEKEKGHHKLAEQLQSLLKSKIIINMDFNKQKINKYKINENAIIINLEGDIKIENKKNKRNKKNNNKNKKRKEKKI